MGRKKEVINNVVEAARAQGIDGPIGRRLRNAIASPGVSKQEARLYKRAGRIVGVETTPGEARGVTKFLTNADTRNDRPRKKK